MQVQNTLHAPELQGLFYPATPTPMNLINQKNNTFGPKKAGFTGTGGPEQLLQHGAIPATASTHPAIKLIATTTAKQRRGFQSLLKIHFSTAVSNFMLHKYPTLWKEKGGFRRNVPIPVQAA